MKSYQKVLIIIGTALVILIAAVIFVFSWEGSPKKIVAVADQFQAPTSWELISERIQGPRIVCVDGSCPSIFRAWLYDKPLTKDDFVTMLEKTDWSYSLDEECQLIGTKHEDSHYPCSAQVTIEDYRGAIYLSKERAAKKMYRLSLSLDPQ